MSRQDDKEATKVFSRRAVLLSTAGAGVFAGLAGRLWQLQVVDAEEYATLSKDNQFNHRPVPPSRGQIMDRDGVIIADNDETWQIRVAPEQMRERDVVLARLADLLDPPRPEGVDDALGIDRRAARIERWTRILARGRRRFDEVTLETAVSWEAFARVNIARPDLPGVIADVGETRAYGVLDEDGARRDSDAFAHVVGYVSKPPEETIEERLNAVRDDAERASLARIMRHPGYRVGRSGIELSLDPALQGDWGEMRIEVDAFGRTIRELGLDQQTRPGDPVLLTLDSHVQRYAQRRLDGESGAAVGIDVETGEIICLVSAPGFDSNRFAKGIEAPAYRALVADPRKPLYNKPLAGLYPPGSTFKMITALAALRHGLVTPNERVICRGKTRLGDREFHCWKREGHGSVDLRLSLKRSCDVYYYEMARRFEQRLGRSDAYERGIDAITEEAKLFGLGDAFPLEAPGSRDGSLPTAAWKRATIGESWADGETLVNAIGQGFITASPLQLAVMTARIANGGRPITPRILVEGREGAPRASDMDRVADPEHMALIEDAMMSVTDEVGGTAYYALGGKGVGIDGVRMAGKSGTSQVRRITMEERAAGVIANEDLPWRRRDHALFVCYAPFDAPRYAVSVIIEHGSSGSRAAAPPARDILREILIRDPRRTLADARTRPGAG